MFQKEARNHGRTAWCLSFTGTKDKEEEEEEEEDDGRMALEMIRDAALWGKDKL